MKQPGKLPGNECRKTMSKTVNGFIALRPIPGCGAAASCRPPRSWDLDRRSGRVPALPYPPPRLPQCIVDHDWRTIDAWVTLLGKERVAPKEWIEPRMVYWAAHPEEDRPRRVL
jgi:hypothetical protein